MVVKEYTTEYGLIRVHDDCYKGKTHEECQEIVNRAAAIAARADRRIWLEQQKRVQETGTE